MKAKIKKPTFSFTPSMLDTRGKHLYLSVAYRELISQLTSQLCMSVDDISHTLQGISNGVADFDCSETFYSNLNTDKRLLLEEVKTIKNRLEKEFN